jgi:hypothetical protein
MSGTGETPTGDDDVEMIEVVTGSVDEDGDVVVDEEPVASRQQLPSR